jgi:hypothetical protein
VNDATRVDGLRRRIVDGGQAGEVAPDHCLGWNVLEAGRGASRVNRLVVVEVEEHLVLPDWTANREAEVVIADARHRTLRAEGIVCGIQRIVLEELIGCTVEVVGAALADLIESRSTNSVLC